MRLQAPAISRPNVWHHRFARRRTIDAEDNAREIQWLLDRPNPIMLARRQYGGWVADRDPADRDRRVLRQNGTQMNKAIDSHLATLADSRFIEHGSRQK